MSTQYYNHSNNGNQHPYSNNSQYSEDNEEYYNEQYSQPNPGDYQGVESPVLSDVEPSNSPIPIEDYDLLAAKVKENVKASAKVAYQISKAKKTLKQMEKLKFNYIQEIYDLENNDKTSEEGSDSDNSISDTNNVSLPAKGNHSRVQAHEQSPAPVKRSRRDIKQVRRVQPIPKDSKGNYILPVQIGILTILSLGTVVTDKNNYHNDRYIWPVGYKIQRYYNSTINPETQACYTASVVESAEGPKFVIEADDRPDDPIIGNTATGAWTAVVRMSNKIRNRNHSNSASGPDYYGFAHPTIAKMIQDLPGADQCKDYAWQEFEVMPLRSVPQRRYVVPPLPDAFNQDTVQDLPAIDKNEPIVESDNDSEHNQYIVSSPKYSDPPQIKVVSKPSRGTSDLNLLLNNSDSE